MTHHYDAKYFEWQKQIGFVGGILNKFKFEGDINRKDGIIMDFGCGGGYLLNNFEAKEKIGFEVNKICWEQCEKFGIKMYDNFDNISDNYIDYIISNHAFEHVSDPYYNFKQLYKKLKSDGKLIIVIPCEQPNEDAFRYKEDDNNQHLYTWCPQTFGNLAKLAGFKIISCNAFQHQWTPKWTTDYKNANYHQLCMQYAQRNNNYQVRLVAKK